MAYVLQYFDEVEKDIFEAKNWYKEQKDGLEIEFANAIEMAISHILLIPEAYAIRYKKIRIARPKKFPFNIHFYLEETHKIVVITAIIHNKRQIDSAKIRT